MRVLVVHNNYSSRVPSGENLAVHDEMAWLVDAGIDVVPHESSNDQVFGGGVRQKARQAAEAVWSVSERRRLVRAVERHEPDLVHVHNLFPLLSASVPWAALRRDLPVVWTVHNRRVRCVGGTNFRAGRPCHQCRPGFRLPGIVHGCYGDSPVPSTLVTISSSLFAAAARRRITTLAISEAVRDWLVGTAGFPDGRVRVKHNGVARPSPATVAGAVAPTASRTFVFAGYVAEHKGVRLLLDAWQRATLPDDAGLAVLGDGPLAGAVQDLSRRDPRVRWYGNVPATEVHGRMATARAAVVPSIWEEPFGRVAAEAMACGRPVITTGVGGLHEVVDEASGWTTGADPAALATTLEAVLADDADVARRAAAAARRHEELFSPEATTRALVDVYEGVLADR